MAILTGTRYVAANIFLLEGRKKSNRKFNIANLNENVNYSQQSWKANDSPVVNLKR